MSSPTEDTPTILGGLADDATPTVGRSQVVTPYETFEFISSVAYFWREKDLDYLMGFSVGRLREVDPTLAKAYEDYLIAKDTFDRLLEHKKQELERGK